MWNLSPYTMKLLETISLLSAFISVAEASTSKQLSLKSTASMIEIDGLLDAVWSTADSVSDFSQMQPFFGKAPSVQTVAKVLSSPQALYCLMICYDTTENIQRNAGVLDQAEGDVVSVMIDTFNDKQTAYKFAVSASGVRADCRLIDDGRNRDYSWDGVWFAESKVYDWGFVVEMEIPYKSIRYSNELANWGLDFDRWIASRHEDLYWCTYEQNEGQRISKFGKLIFDGVRPTASGMNLEVYPVGIAKATWVGNGKYDVDPSAGIDIFYNPSEKLTFQLTGNPDFAQIEADPFEFNISRYETYFSERRPFFTEGNEIFMASGRERNSGFYTPLELFYSRRIGKLLPDRSEVPLIVGTKAFGRLDDWQYGGFLALTGSKNYQAESFTNSEPRAYFGSVRLKKQILENSSIGILFVGKKTSNTFDGVLDVDGAFRTSRMQLAYQIARSMKDGHGDFAGSVGFKMSSKNWWNAFRLRAVGTDFDVQQVGFVPWKGTLSFVGLTGPAWFFDDGAITNILLYFGPAFTYEDADRFADYAGVIGMNMSFRSDWGYEVNFNVGGNKDANKRYTSYTCNFSSWFNMSPNWNANVWGGYERTYNFSRDFLAFYSWLGADFRWKALNILELGTSYNMHIEGNPNGGVQDITYNARPFISISPVNDLRIRAYLDNVYVRSSDKLESLIFGFLVSYNFLPKSWIYFAINEAHDRRAETEPSGKLLPRRLHLTDRAGVLKVKYLYYL